MLPQQDREAIDGLFDKIETVAQQSDPRDPDAEALIQQRLRDYPPAPYYLAQTVIMQEQALRLAQERIEQLEAQATQRPSGGFLGGLFGGEETPAQQRRPRGPWDQAGQADNRRQGGGFLAGAAQTALGVTGGVLLGSAIAGMLTGGAQAEEAALDQPEPEQDVDTGGDFGDDDNFDMGGDF